MGDYGYCIQHLLGQLRLNIEGAYGVNIIIEEVYAVRVLAAEGIDIDDGAANGKLPRFIDVIALHESQFAQLMLHVCDGDCLPFAQSNLPVIQL